MLPLEYPDRATRRNIPRGEDEWDLSIFFRLEQQAIERYLGQMAQKNWQQLGREGALRASDQLMDAIQATYAPKDEVLNPKIYADAQNGHLKRQAPSVKAIVGMRVAFWIAVLAETTVMLVQQALTGDFNPFIVVLAILLALGGYLQGRGLGEYLAKRWAEDTGRLPKPDVRLAPQWLQLGIGTALILLIAVVRGAGAFEPVQFALVFFVTLLLGEAVAVFEALQVRHRSVRDALLVEMEQAQRWQANISHRDRLMRDGYRKAYETAILQAEQAAAQPRGSEAR
jgi:hypothetical protein